MTMKSAKILIVEDEKILALALKRILEKLGHEVVASTGSGEEAIALNSKLSPDLIMMDIFLETELDGLSAAEKIRLSSDVPIIFLTSYDDQKILQSAKKLQASGYILKPFDEKEININIDLALYRYFMAQRLKESEEQYRSLFNSLSEAVILVNNSGLIVSCNPAIEKIFGFSIDKLIGKHITEVHWNAVNSDGSNIQPNDIPFIKAVNDAHIIDNCIIGFKNIRNEIVWTSINVHKAITSQYSQNENCIVSFRDISNQVYAEISYQTIVDNSLQGVLIIQDSNIVFCNKTMKRFIGLNTSNFKSIPDTFFLEIIDNKFKNDFHNKLLQLEQSGNAIENYELSIQTKNTIRWLLINAVPFMFLGRPAIQILSIDITESKHYGTKLQLALNKFKSVVDNSLEGITVINENGIISEWNPNMQKFFGFKSKEILGQYIWDFFDKLKSLKIIDAFEPATLKENFHELWKNGKCPQLTKKNFMKVVLPEAKIAFIEFIAYPIKTENGIIVSMAFRDVTDEKYIENELIVQRKSLNALINSGNDAAVLFSINFKIEALNIKAAMLIANTKEANNLIGKNFFDFYKGDYCEFLKDSVHTMLNSAAPLRVEIGDDTKGIFEIIFYPVVDITGSISKFSAYFRDITKTKYANKKAKENEEKYRLLFEDSPIPHAVIDLSDVKSYIDGLNQIGMKDLHSYIDSIKPYDENPLAKFKIIDINNAAVNLFGDLSKTTVFPEIHKFFNAHFLSIYKNLLKSLIAGNSAFEIEDKIALINNQELNIIWKIVISPGSEKTWTKLLLSLIDITAQVRNKEQLLIYSQTIQEAERKKNEASQVIDSSARLASIGVIASGITHEINQPLNAIKMGSDGILFWNKTQKILPSMIVEMLEGISQASSKIEEIIKHMRAFWIDANASELGKVDLNKSIDQALTLIHQKLFSHEINLIVEKSLDDCFIYANELQLELIINNLIIQSTASLDAKDIKNKEIKISTYKAGAFSVLQISDNGMGLSVTEKDKIFDPFYIMQNSTDYSSIGLAIVKMFTDRFSAKISAENDKDGGTIYTIQFRNYDNLMEN